MAGAERGENVRSATLAAEGVRSLSLITLIAERGRRCSESAQGLSPSGLDVAGQQRGEGVERADSTFTRRVWNRRPSTDKRL